MKIMSTNLPVITLDMHQRTATDHERAHRSYTMIDWGEAWPELLSANQLESQSKDWEWGDAIKRGRLRIVARVEVDLPEICLGSAHDIEIAILEAATNEAVKMGIYVQDAA
jgi:hypothetical protein